MLLENKVAENYAYLNNESIVQSKQSAGTSSAAAILMSAKQRVEKMPAHSVSTSSAAAAI